MKIIDVRVHLLRKKLSSPMRISRGGFTFREHAVVEVITDAGISGLGEGVGDPPMVKAIIEGVLRNEVKGLDPLNIEGIRNKLLDGKVYFERKGSVICAASAIETACWDILGKEQNLPLYQLLGGLVSDKIEVYASDVYWEENSRSMASNAERIAKQGIRTVKIHLGCLPPEQEVERIRVIREVLGPDVCLMIDLNAGYDGASALRAAQLWEKYDIYWLEEPVNPSLADIQADLRKQTNIPIASGENEFRLEGFKYLFDQGAVDIAMPDIGRVGGIQETYDICMLAKTFDVAISPHNFSSGVLLAATAHLMFAVANTKLLEIDTSDNAVYHEFFPDPFQIKDGFAFPSDRPGLGVELSEEILELYCEN
jgi:L-alanine-DL-glutamate epimerase-like enolase superfamily enzyme